MSNGKGDRDRTNDREEYGRGLERIKRNEARKRAAAERKYREAEDEWDES